MCTGCHAVVYCGRDCQELDFKVHSGVCELIKESNQLTERSRKWVEERKSEPIDVVLENEESLVIAISRFVEIVKQRTTLEIIKQMVGKWTAIRMLYLAKTSPPHKQMFDCIAPHWDEEEGIQLYKRLAECEDIDAVVCAALKDDVQIVKDATQTRPEPEAEAEVE
jgi:hypothetical protein